MLRTVAYLRQNQPKEGNTRHFVISDEALDRHGTVLKMDGWKLDNFRRNPIVMYAHAANREPNPDLVIGRGDVRTENGELIGSITFDTDGGAEVENKLAKKVLHKIDNGFLNATSVGFNPLRWGYGEKERGEDPDTFYFREQELLEFSVVPVPSNPNALAKEYSEEITDWIEKNKSGSFSTADIEPNAVPITGTMTLKDDDLHFVFDMDRVDTTHYPTVYDTNTVNFEPDFELDKKDSRVQLARARFRKLNYKSRL